MMKQVFSGSLYQKFLIFCRKILQKGAPQYELKSFVIMATYWVPDLPNIKGLSGHLWHSILIFANDAPYG